jgi:hypothetical protein
MSNEPKPPPPPPARTPPPPSAPNVAPRKRDVPLPKPPIDGTHSDKKPRFHT